MVRENWHPKCTAHFVEQPCIYCQQDAAGQPRAVEPAAWPLWDWERGAALPTTSALEADAGETGGDGEPDASMGWLDPVPDIWSGRTNEDVAPEAATTEVGPAPDVPGLQPDPSPKAEPPGPSPVPAFGEHSPDDGTATVEPAAPAGEPVHPSPPPSHDEGARLAPVLDDIDVRDEATTGLTEDQVEYLEAAEAILLDSGWPDDGRRACLSCFTVTTLQGIVCGTCLAQDRDRLELRDVDLWTVTDYREVSTDDRKGDGLDGDEFLKHAYLKSAGIVAGTRGRYNAALLTPQALHRRLTDAQGEHGLHDAETLTNLTIDEFMRRNLECMREVGIPRDAARAVVAYSLEQVPALLARGVQLY